jgi:transposase
MDGQARYPLVVCSPPGSLPSRQEREPSQPPPPLPTVSGPTAATRTGCPIRACPETIHLRQQANFWKNVFERCRQRQSRLQELAEAKRQQLYQQSQERERVLKEQIVALKAELLVLQQRLRGRKSEKKKKHPDKGPETDFIGPPCPPRQRGQQPTNPAPQRRTFDHLPTQDETCELPAGTACCPCCHAPFAPFPGSDDGDILEVEVRAYRRRYRRTRYRKTCTCAATPMLPTAPPPPKLIPKGYLGISVWVLLLLEKYAAYQPTYRFLSLLRSFGLDLPLGTVTDGLKKLVCLFEPLYLAMCKHQRDEHHWHCDETRWLVFIEHEGKVGHNWSLWVFRSPQAVVFVLDPTRAHHVPQTHLLGASGIASVDRASAYKAMEQVKNEQIVLAFCWAHVRRDFLEALTGYAELNDWVVSWLEEIRELYRRNDARLAALTVTTTGAAPSGALPDTNGTGPLLLANDSEVALLARSSPPSTVSAAEEHLREHVAHLAQRRDAELQKPDLPRACTKVLTSLQNHWSGLTVFLDHPEVPLDNNAAERAERGPVVARKNYYGSGALWSGRLAAMMFSLLQTLAVWNLCPLRWLTAYLTACAESGAKPPPQAEAFLPWNLTVEQKQQWALPSSQPQRSPGTNTS